MNAAPADGCTSEIPIGLWGPFVSANGDVRSLDTPSSLDPACVPLSELHQLGQALQMYHVVLNYRT